MTSASILCQRLTKVKHDLFFGLLDIAAILFT